MRNIAHAGAEQNVNRRAKGRLCLPFVLLPFAIHVTVGCAIPVEFEPDEDNADVLNTETELAWRQFQENMSFIEQYRATCQTSDNNSRIPRLLVAGFGRYQLTRNNASGRIVSALLDTLDYPETQAPPRGQVDAPGPQTAVTLERIILPDVGEVEVCGMVIPPYWDLAAATILYELDAFQPDMVFMNGVRYSDQLFIELGATNEASGSADGSNILAADERDTALISEAPLIEFNRPSLLSWESVATAAADTLTDQMSTGNFALSDHMESVVLAEFPRSSTYVCNNTTYVVGYAMDHFGQPLRLMEASHLHDPDARGFIEISLRESFLDTPRVFLHWPISIEGASIDAGAAVLRSMLGAQVLAMQNPDDLPTRGHNSLATN